MAEPAFSIVEALFEDAPAILALQRLAFESEAQLYNDWTIPPLTQTLESLQAEFQSSTVLKASRLGQIVGSVRVTNRLGVCSLSRLVVSPHFQRKGLGSALLNAAEAIDSSATRFELSTGSKSAASIRLYQRHGYAVIQTSEVSPFISLVLLSKYVGTPSNNSFKPNPLRSFKTPCGSSSGSA